MLRVVVTGSESTGKTTLARNLAAHYETAWLPEFAREYVRSVGRTLTAADVEPIALGQLAAEDARARGAHRLLIQDTDLVSTLVYSRYYYGTCPPWIADAARRRLAELYLLLHPDVPWIADGLQRDRPEGREEIHARFAETLRSLGANVVDLRGPWHTRLDAAFSAVDAMLKIA